MILILHFVFNKVQYLHYWACQFLGVPLMPCSGIVTTYCKAPATLNVPVPDRVPYGVAWDGMMICVPSAQMNWQAMVVALLQQFVVA